MSISEIARVLRISRNTVRSALAKGCGADWEGSKTASAVQQPMQQPRRPTAPVGTVRRPLTCANDP